MCELFSDRKLSRLHYPMSTPTSQHLFEEAVGLKLYRYIKTWKVTTLNFYMWLYLMHFNILKKGQKIWTKCKHWNTEQWALPRGEMWGQVSRHNIFINQSIHNLVLWVFLYKDTLLNIFCWFINTELTANSSVTQTWMKLT